MRRRLSRSSTQSERDHDRTDRNRQDPSRNGNRKPVLRQQHEDLLHKDRRAEGQVPRRNTCGTAGQVPEWSL